MQLAEIRELDGPNLFMLEPAIKVEIVFESGDSRDVLRARFGGGSTLPEAARRVVEWLYQEGGQPAPRVVTRIMDDFDHISIAFSWTRRRFALLVGQAIFDLASGSRLADDLASRLRDALEIESADDQPLVVRDDQHNALVFGVTGTNGKTTTTRLIAHLLRTAGLRTGWTSSSGIYIEGELIEDGDYSGPSGARRVLEDSTLEAAVLETARGGILLRGLGYEHNDVSVFTNISEDHLDLQGVRTLSTLAEVKAVVCRVTKPEGVCVVNADDPLVMKATANVNARRTFVTRDENSPLAIEHLRQRGTVIVGTDEAVVVKSDGKADVRFEYVSMPMTHYGRAFHMVENAMCAIGAALGAGLSADQLRPGLSSFENDPTHNPGRMNVYSCDGVTVILDFAHNETGLKYLLEFGRGDVENGGRLISIIGTAGDRTDGSLRKIGQIASDLSDLVIAKGTKKYLRGRTPAELMAIYRSGAMDNPAVEYREAADELSALELALELGRPGDAIAMMVHEQVPALVDLLESRSR
jgi:cyanophycin synthetase